MKKLSFYIKDFCIAKEADVAFIPPLVRRKLSTIDKFALTAFEKVYTPEVEEIVFASEFGEVERLNKIIEQYQTMNEVSPAQFSGSVHNYPAGFFTLLKKINIPYYALSSGENTISTGLIKSIITPRGNILFCFADDIGISCIVSKTEGKIKCTFEDKKEPSLNERENFINFLTGNTKEFQTLSGTFKREN